MATRRRTHPSPLAEINRCITAANGNGKVIASKVRQLRQRTSTIRDNGAGGWEYMPRGGKPFEVPVATVDELLKMKEWAISAETWLRDVRGFIDDAIAVVQDGDDPRDRQS